ncbi:uncharacterized protein Nmag_4191 (plasmid) [Natrialba magadii ATCC 43099]|uniref:Integral membrane protein n=1 Tax=Natrialba magadii (strain ATCC 43099 / DSM 3394 / CCM 3739 / CIP 104546 / IAM 13178 / JCM 8861 / NBRC 102185 / NCIMB 2190 / MS3) TaxID=547559 RepID=D3T290_NATMM|nr:hypothetical protein [Natrialba magadii]ADD07699.1 uncharacterized protein Nmag_4191 [Natrialba magadii ATCC 43099]ELY26511.1 hypothetical protein C500_15150 [Natrialba magadii ATCC 43099]
MPEINPPPLFEKKYEGRPPVDILGLVAGLVVFAGFSFLFAALSQLSGPVVETGISPQTVAALQWSGVGIILGVLAIFVYQRRPIGWYGTLVAAIAGAIQALRLDIPFGSVLIIYLSVPLVVLTLLLVRRDMFLGR